MTDSFAVSVDRLEETVRVASILAARLQAGDVVLLTGDLGAGKTTFVKAVAEALGATDPVTSPTFTLAQHYPTPTVSIVHVDTYRLADVGEYRDLGLDDAYPAESVFMVEWGELVAGEFADPLRVNIGADAENPVGRTVEFVTTGPRWGRRFDDMRAELMGVAR
jgi:tRNA threonylcarbamoyladenosine biosynthesis protein TsaE